MCSFCGVAKWPHVRPPVTSIKNDWLGQRPRLFGNARTRGAPRRLQPGPLASSASRPTAAFGEAEQLGIGANLMGAANCAGGVMGKMIDAQSIVVASTATGWFNHEGDILRYVFFHSLALACLVGLYVTLQAYVYPFTLMVVH